MKAVILAIGSELLQGFLTDTNSTFLAQELSAIGIEVVGIAGVGDDQDSIVRQMRRALDDADLVVCTGGIGPTSDDLTREAVAEICGETPHVDPKSLEAVKSFFTRRGAEMPERNAKQAWLIPSAESLQNPMGTAPGWFVRHQDAVIVIMPGVPREMMPMWTNETVPHLLSYLGADTIASRTLKTIGIGESAVEERLRDLIDRGYPAVSTYAKNDGVHIRILAVTDNGATAMESVARTVSEVQALIGKHVYGELDASLPYAVLEPLLAIGDRLAIVEQGTAGQVATLLLSDERVEGAVCETRTLGAATDTIARSPLERARELQSSTGAEFALGVVASVDAQDDMGRWDAVVEIAVIGPNTQHVSTHTLAARRLEVGRRASLLAAEVLREVLLDSTDHRRV